MDADLIFSSRRSPVVCLHGCVASSQQLATGIGLDILKRGGNAADAAVAVAAALGVTEPSSTGLGGDTFCLFYNGSTGQVKGINGSGRTPRAQTLDFLEGRGYSAEAPPSAYHALNVTVPGAAACWVDVVELFGSRKLSLQEVMCPAVELAREGFPLTEVTVYHWARSVGEAGKELGADFLINGQAPNHGQVFRNPALARTLQDLGERGKTAFYKGRVAEAIVKVITEHGGVMTLEDLGSHDSEVVEPIHTDYKGVRLWEAPPNGQGMAALLTLNILDNFPLQELAHNSGPYIHLLCEAVRLSSMDTFRYCGDQQHVTLPLDALLAKDYARRRAKLIHMDRAMEEVEPGVPTGSDTVYFCVIDSHGNACSFVSSNYSSFGTGLVPVGCGFALQNRGANFTLQRNHRNSVGGAKRPFHTIMPALLTDSASGRLLASLGVMGGFMQPQGHVQVLLNMKEFGMNPQQALDAPRIYVDYNLKANQWSINLEEGVNREVAEELRRRGHQVNWPITGHERSQFGRGQIITVGEWWNPSVGEAEAPIRVLWAGSDPRGDGCAQGY
ncbi:glutathione hydrolase-like YwrD proenzyme [Aplochiton taeniatus]